METFLAEARNIATDWLRKLDISKATGAPPSRADGETVLRTWTTDERHLAHAYAVASACEGYAKVLGQPTELFWLTGLLHDLDNERYPYKGFQSLQEHPLTAMPVLRQAGYPDILIHAILAHARVLNIQLVTTLSRVLFAVDELSGFLLAVKAIRPGKTLASIDWRSVQKKLNDGRFATGCSRENIRRGAELLGYDDEEGFQLHVARVADFIDCKKVADQDGHTD